MPDAWKLRHGEFDSFDLDVISAVKMDLYVSATLKVGVVKLAWHQGAG